MLERDVITLARQFFDLDLPVEASELKAAYRRQVKALHPDVNDGDTTALFQELQSIYKILTESDTVLIAGVVSCTVEGIALGDLGCGLAPNINSVSCDYCKRQGYYTTIGSRFVDCTDCDAMGLAIKSCPQCQGSRGFTALDGLHVTCWTCNDRGTIPGKVNANWLWSSFCSSCNGTKRKSVPYGQIHHKCFECKGIGEIQIFNPVIPKGRLS